jgi:ferredoxin
MKIKFLPTQVEIEGDPNKSLLQLCTENKIEIRSICKGVPSCAECRVKLVSGEHNVNPPSKAEISLIGSNYFIDQRRLSCQLHCFGDVTVDISEQIDRGDNQNKKVRGFRVQGQKGNQPESHAKQGTLVLEENLNPPAAAAQNPPREKQHQQQREPRSQQQKQGQQNRGGGQQQNRKQNQNRNQQQQSQKSDRK